MSSVSTSGVKFSWDVLTLCSFKKFSTFLNFVLKHNNHKRYFWVFMWLISSIYFSPAGNILLILPGSLSPSHLNSLDSDPGRRDLSGVPLCTSSVLLNNPLSLHTAMFGMLAVALVFTAWRQQLSSLLLRGTGDRARGTWEIKLNGWSSDG